MKGLWLLRNFAIILNKKPLIKGLRENYSQNISSDIFFTNSSLSGINFYKFLNQ